MNSLLLLPHAAVFRSVLACLCMAACAGCAPLIENTTVPHPAKIRTVDSPDPMTHFWGRRAMVDAIDDRINGHVLHGGEPFLVAPGPHRVRVRSQGPNIYLWFYREFQLDLRPDQELVMECLRSGPVVTAFVYEQTPGGRREIAHGRMKMMACTPSGKLKNPGSPIWAWPDEPPFDDDPCPRP